MHPNDGGSPFRRPLTLRDWHFCYGLPVTPDGYLASAANGGFALVGGYRDWYEYEGALARIKGVLGAFARAGLHVAWGPRPWVFCSLLRRRHAVILLTHATRATETHDGTLEFRGEMVPFRMIVGKISPSFDGILDICACEAHGIQELVKRRAPGCVTKVADRKLTLDVWRAYYAEFLRLLFEAPISYYDATIRANTLI
jgi:hypothetical protein